VDSAVDSARGFDRCGPWPGSAPLCVLLGDALEVRTRPAGARLAFLSDL